jgi:hypothetical protein
VVVRRWHAPPDSERVLHVWLDAQAQELDGWHTYGPRRLRTALDEWNSIRLPVRLVPATSARESDILVDIVGSLPTVDESVARDQAGITNVSYEPSGNILKARVLIAVATPIGRRYPLVAQQANLLHELGHAIGLPHAAETGAVMATRRSSYQLTGSDITLAREHYAGCSGA